VSYAVSLYGVIEPIVGYHVRESSRRNVQSGGHDYAVKSV
jgi:hypothetical protein